MGKIKMFWIFLILLLSSSCGSLIVHDEPYYDPSITTIYYNYPYYYNGPYRGAYYYRPVPPPKPKHKPNIKPNRQPVKPPINQNNRGRHR